MAGSPRYIFRGLSQTQLETIRAAAVERITNGSFTNLSGAQKSSTREYMDPAETLFEVNAALAALGVSGYDLPAQKVYANFTSEPIPPEN